VLLAGLAEVAVTADHPEFAAQHRDLLLQLLRGDQPLAPPFSAPAARPSAVLPGRASGTAPAREADK
jgi:hypothetical protein